MNILLYTALFVAFVPGLLFKVAIPKQKYGAIIAHAVLFTIAVYILQRIAKQYPMLEGFESSIETELNTARTEAEQKINEINNKLKDKTLPTNIRNSLKTVLQQLTTLRGNLKQLSERLAKDLDTLKTRQNAVAKLSTSATAKMRNDATAAVNRSEAAVKTTTDIIKQKIQQLNTAKNTATTQLASILRTASGFAGSLPSIIPGSASLSTVAQNMPTLAPALAPVPAPPTTLARQGSSSSMAIRMGSSSSMPQPIASEPAFETSIQNTVNRAVGATLSTTTTMPRFGM